MIRIARDYAADLSATRMAFIADGSLQPLDPARRLVLANAAELMHCACELLAVAGNDVPMGLAELAE